jgi:hypothetical protein
MKALKVNPSELELETSVSFEAKLDNIMRARRIDEMRRLSSRENPCRVNLTRGCRMK